MRIQKQQKPSVTVNELVNSVRQREAYSLSNELFSSASEHLRAIDDELIKVVPKE